MKRMSSKFSRCCCCCRKLPLLPGVGGRPLLLVASLEDETLSWMIRTAITFPYAPTLALTASTTPRTTRAGGELARRDVLSKRSSALMRPSVAPAAGASTRESTPAKRSSSGEVGCRRRVAWI